MEKDYILNWLRENLDKERFLHSLGTAKMAAQLAKKYGLNEEKAELAGLVHDCAKCYPTEELLRIIKEQLPEIPECELLNYKTFHAPVGALVAKEKFGIEDEQILNAIRSHTIGRVNMSTFEMAIYLADKIEEETRPKDFSDEILHIVKFGTLESAVLKCIESTIKSLVARRLKVCHTTIDVYNWLLSH